MPLKAVLGEPPGHLPPACTSSSLDTRQTALQGSPVMFNPCTTMRLPPAMYSSSGMPPKSREGSALPAWEAWQGWGWGGAAAGDGKAPMQ